MTWICFVVLQNQPEEYNRNNFEDLIRTPLPFQKRTKQRKWAFLLSLLFMAHRSKYKKLKELGVGGFGTVTLVEVRETGEKAVIKQIWTPTVSTIIMSGLIQLKSCLM